MAFSAHAPNRIVTGYDLFAVVEGAADDLPAAEAYCTYLLGHELANTKGELIAGIEATLSYQNGMNPGYPGLEGLNWIGYTPAYVHLKLPANVAAGEYEFRFTLATTVSTASSFDGSYTQTLLLPLAISQLPLRTVAPVPGVEEWQQKMVELADRWAPQILDPTNGLGESNWYYDVPSTYWQIGDYLRKSNHYADVALASEQRYADYLQSNGSAAPWCVFPLGLRQSYERTQDRRWVDAMQMLTNGGWVACGGNPAPSSMRETAYSLNVWRELTYLDASNREMLDRSVTYLLGQFNLLCAQQFKRAEGMVCQPFFFGLAMQSLVDYYGLVKDDRIPQTLAATCEWLWQNAVDAATGYVKYDVWVGNEAYTSLNGLMVNAWGFLWQQTGDRLFREQGDILFEHMFDDGQWGWSPKQFAQIFWRSIDYVARWRA